VGIGAFLDVGVLEPDAFAQAFPFDKQGLDQAVRKLRYRP